MPFVFVVTEEGLIVSVELRVELSETVAPDTGLLFVLRRVNVIVEGFDPSAATEDELAPRVEREAEMVEELPEPEFPEFPEVEVTLGLGLGDGDVLLDAIPAIVDSVFILGEHATNNRFRTIDTQFRWSKFILSPPPSLTSSFDRDESNTILLILGYS